MTIHKRSGITKLDPLVGHWRSEGEVLATSTTPLIRINGTDTYEWVCDGKFLLHKVDVSMGCEKVAVIEMIGYDPEAGNYPMRSFDNQGAFTTMYSTVDENGVIRIQGDGIRSALTVSDDRKTMSALWERSADGVRWHAWMNMRFTKE